MFRSKYRITLDDGTEHEVTSGPREQILLERRYNIPSSHLVRMETARLEYRLFTAWAAMKHDGTTDRDFEEWLGHVDDVELFVTEIPERMEACIALHESGWDPQRIAAAFDVPLGALAQWCGIAPDRNADGSLTDEAHVVELITKALDGGGDLGEATATSVSPAE